MKRTLITGVAGQDGSHLASLLLAKGHEVYGLYRRSSTTNRQRLRYIASHDRFRPIEADVTDAGAVCRTIGNVEPDYVYNLASQSHVATSFRVPQNTLDVVAGGLLNVLEAVRSNGFEDVTRIYQAGSSEMFGSAPAPQNEDSPFLPRSPYAIAKVTAHHLARNYRESYGMHVCNGIMFNHEGPKRGEDFVTRKISRAVGRIKVGLQDRLVLGNVDSRRDWGYAPDYVEAMEMILEADEPNDYVVATGESHSVLEFLELAFATVGLNHEDHVKYDDPGLVRPSDVPDLRGDASRIHAKLGWKAHTSFRDLVDIMVRLDLHLAEREVVG